MALSSLRPKLLRGLKKKRKSRSKADVDESERAHSTCCQADHRGSENSDSTHATFQLSTDDELSRDSSIDRCVHQRSYGSLCDHTDSEEEELDSRPSSDGTRPDGCRRHAATLPGRARRLRYHRFGDERRPRHIAFLDEERGLTPRHLVTQCNYRPSLTDEERDALFYSVVDFERFEKESLYEEVEEEIRALELARERGGLEIDDERIRSLIRRMKSHCKTHYLD